MSGILLKNFISENNWSVIYNRTSLYTWPKVIVLIMLLTLL